MLSQVQVLYSAAPLTATGCVAAFFGATLFTGAAFWSFFTAFSFSRRHAPH